MSAELTPTPEKKRTFSLSIGQLTFGSFLLVLAVIIVTSTASVIAIRHIDTTFAELQRLQSVGDLAEDIDRRMNELRLAARDFVTDPGAGIQFKQVGEAAGDGNPFAPAFYQASSQAELTAALERITGVFSTCVFPLKTPPPVPDKIAVKVSGMKAPPSTTDGWAYSKDDFSEITVNGSWCEMIRTTAANKVEIVFGCPDIEIP